MMDTTAVIHPRFHHFNLKTTRLREMIDFYRTPGSSWLPSSRGVLASGGRGRGWPARVASAPLSRIALNSLAAGGR
jgi:hypothetical protein